LKKNEGHYHAYKHIDMLILLTIDSNKPRVSTL